MAVTATPVFPQGTWLSSVRITAGNSSSQGGGTIGTDIWLAGTAGSNGGFVERVRFSPTATAPTNTNATVARVFYSSVTSGATTNANTFLLGEVTLPLVPADNASTSATFYDLALNITIPAGNTILVTNHTSPAANTAWVATVIGAQL